jgi:hypothetical protein
LLVFVASFPPHVAQAPRESFGIERVAPDETAKEA